MTLYNVLIEVGLYSNPVTWSYVDYGQLATKATWFQNLWLLADTCKASICFWEEDLVQDFCEHDWSLTLEFYHLGYCGSELTALNTVRLFQNLLYVSDIENVMVIHWTSLSSLIHWRPQCFIHFFTRNQQWPTTHYDKKQLTR
jgi:hypothetical protein